MTEQPSRRLLLVHAHPDDESINNGATMARYAAEGAQVTLVTCTLGERGEVIPPELAHLNGPALGRHRMGELTTAMGELGVRDVRLLGGPGRFADSGMMGLPDNEDPGCFWQADVDEAAALLAEVIRETRPQVLVTYDPDGGYGHPDHIQAHRVATRAAELAAAAGHGPARVYWNRVPRTTAEAAFARLGEELRGLPFDRAATVDDVPGVVEDERIDVEIAAGDTPYAAAKAAAMRAHATQIEVAGSCFALSNALAQPLFTTEYYELAAGQPLPEARATDLFAGLAADAGAAS
ncbi:N-acetyl-1-D-myo-inositol-2-amino-2-deoxy-alpha-D-glucopyranoside deacetylase [Streptomyces griseoviridis]|uniref:1D-myo-inositol 2-acetamido-2-deoxy-alpha-D-glucopyranoside deacetylase n=2 Tax=Streptomyces griseoviridis TaxID=45398 RepID=A0ABT9LKU8_STRGD|nr:MULTISPECIES: N-acetyl-1-D-myo-inositol-2-amino-2-deoxy-alpha-D-glucopyranoside deacetylase [Streptomyces]MDP9683900.1 N-acetyl-1-D-myo-inositol-2-amino-2-deoxy-alpha-D-glucopyranoside deacetylase [Streptomyces griseoviridis]GGS26349.1 1D-myo-inositol 2-acetamido-2-deoxy-alpha-D-glucopyranoside deacetylase [Streptomyces niveoruber]GGS85902.1 1D-myo-inositol 2-acetamido-2-deoxy-alpha-D-glucopyranoside deacetylase [Streptomyces griseoviridis]